MTEPIVPPSALPLTVEDAREVLSKPLLRLCSEHGPTRVGLAVGGADDKTIRDARDEKSSLRLDYAANLLLLDGTALDGFLARVGRRSVPAESICDTDALPAMTGAVHKLVLATDPRSPGGKEVLNSELVDAEPEIRKAFDSLAVLLRRIDVAKGVAA